MTLAEQQSRFRTALIDEHCACILWLGANCTECLRYGPLQGNSRVGIALDQKISRNVRRGTASLLHVSFPLLLHLIFLLFFHFSPLYFSFLYFFSFLFALLLFFSALYFLHTFLHLLVFLPLPVISVSLFQVFLHFLGYSLSFPFLLFGSVLFIHCCPHAMLIPSELYQFQKKKLKSFQVKYKCLYRRSHNYFLGGR